jgi:hypothetical protein
MAYFKYQFLNALRDELALTRGYRKLTLFILLYLVLPAGGLGGGLAWGAKSHSLVRIVIGGAGGILAGAIVAGLLPRALWRMLQLFERKQCFTLTPCSQAVPTMTVDAFESRSEALRRQWRPHFLVTVLLGVPAAWGVLRLYHYMERTTPPVWAQVLVTVGFLTLALGYVFLQKRGWTRLIRKFGLACPNCGREITDATGLSRVPHAGLCRHCGAKVIQL